MKTNTTTENPAARSFSTKLNAGGMKTYQTSRAPMTVAARPPTRPPIHALKNAAGKNRNQT